MLVNPEHHRALLAALGGKLVAAAPGTSGPMATARMKLYARLDERNAILARAGCVCLAVFPVLVLLIWLDDRLLTGVNIWLKPSKFALSIGVYLWTMAWLFGELRRRKWLLTSLALAIAAAMLMEQSLITLQAARGTTSHFNVSTSFDAAVFGLMGMGVAVNSSAAALVLLLFCFERDGDRPGYMWGIRSGLVLFLLGSLEGFAMIQNAAHTVGSPDGGPGIALLNWSTAAGDLRIAHFVGIHAIQVLPLLGYLADRGAASTTARKLAVCAAALAYAALGTFAYQQAMAGRPAIFQPRETADILYSSASSPPEAAPPAGAKNLEGTTNDVQDEFLLRGCGTDAACGTGARGRSARRE